MTENIVPRVAKFADLCVGMTIERVWRDSSYGRKVTHEGIVGRVLPHQATDERGGWLYNDVDDDDPHVTLRILAEPTPKPLPGWGTLVRVIGGQHDGKHAVAIARDDTLCPWYAKGYGWVSVGEITDWEVIHDPSAPTADPLDENDHRHRIDKNDHMVVRVGPGQWNNCGETPCGGRDLAWWSDHYGPLRFADEVSA